MQLIGLVNVDLHVYDFIVEIVTLLTYGYSAFLLHVSNFIILTSSEMGESQVLYIKILWLCISCTYPSHDGNLSIGL